MREFFPFLIDENGDRKPFEQFLNDVRKIDQTYNSAYLQAEYNFAQASAQMAAKWEQFAEDGDRYNLQYRTAGDSHVRKEHALLDGITLPPSDPFWETYYPPNGWNCFTANTPVLTGKGWKAISEIQKGDSVVGGSGKLRTVIATHAKEVDEELVCIVTKGATATCTKNHRFRTLRGWIAAEDLQRGDVIIQLGKVSALHPLIHAIRNANAILQYALVALIRKGKAVAALAVNHKAKTGNVEVHDKAAEQLTRLEWKGLCRQIARHDFLALAKWQTRRTHTPGMKTAGAPLFHGISLTGSGTEAHAFSALYTLHSLFSKSFFHNSYMIVEGKVTKEKEKTTVYNLSVAEDESYIVPVGIAHNCRCSAVQVRKKKYPETPRDEAMALGEQALQQDTKGMFAFNSGLQQKTFPDYNPYTIRRCRDCDVPKGKTTLAYVPENQLCASCRLLHQCAGQRDKTQAAVLRKHYISKEMAPLLTTKVTKQLPNGRTISVGFNRKGNAHLYSDTIARTRRIKADELKNMGAMLESATYLGEAEHNPTHKNTFDHFYYFKLRTNRGWVRINAGKLTKRTRSGRVRTE